MFLSNLATHQNAYPAILFLFITKFQQSRDRTTLENAFNCKGISSIKHIK